MQRKYWFILVLVAVLAFLAGNYLSVLNFDLFSSSAGGCRAQFRTCLNSVASEYASCSSQPPVTTCGNEFQLSAEECTAQFQGCKAKSSTTKQNCSGSSRSSFVLCALARNRTRNLWFEATCDIRFTTRAALLS